MRRVLIYLIFFILVFSMPIQAKSIIKEQPESVVTRIGETVEFTCKTSVKGCKFQWYESLNKKKWKKVPEAKHKYLKLNITDGEYDKTYFRCRVSYKNRKYYSKFAKLKISYELSNPCIHEGIIETNVRHKDGIMYIYSTDLSFNYAIKDAIDQINMKCGKMFQMTYNINNADIIVIGYYYGKATTNEYISTGIAKYLNSEKNSLNGAVAYYHSGKKRNIIAVNKANVVFDYLGEGIIIHELGHCLGLDHTNENSIMQPIIANNTMTRYDIEQFKYSRTVLNESVSLAA